MCIAKWLFWAIVPLVVAIGPGGVPAAAQSDHVTVGFSNISATELPLWFASEQGYFDRHSVSADLQLISGGANTVAALLSGQVQIADAGGSEAVSAVANGADLVVLANATPVYPYVFEVVPEITTPADLVGKKIGVASFGGSADIATRVVLRQSGIDPDSDVTIIATGSSANRTAALLSGAIQGGMASGPPDTLELEAQGLHPLFDLAALKLPAANTSLIAQRSWVNANQALVQRYVDAFVEASAHLKQDRPAAIGVLKKYFKSDDDAAMGTTYDYFANEVVSALPYPKAEQFADAIAQLAVSNPKVKDVDLTSVLDPSFVQSAADRGLNT